MTQKSANKKQQQQKQKTISILKMILYLSGSHELSLSSSGFPCLQSTVLFCFLSNRLPHLAPFPPSISTTITSCCSRRTRKLMRLTTAHCTLSPYLQLGTRLLAHRHLSGERLSDPARQAGQWSRGRVDRTKCVAASTHPVPPSLVH